MICIRPVLLLIVSLLLGMTTVAQEPSRATPATATPPVVVLSEVERIKVPMSGPPGVAVGLPMLCTPDGALFLPIVTQEDFVDLVSISNDGKRVRRFDKSSINDVPNPSIGTFFVTGSDLYLEVTGFREQEPATLMIPHLDGSTTRQKGSRYKDAKTYLAHFHTDGRYVSAVPLDLDFHLVKFGVFPSGEILVAGIKYGPGAAEPRLALLQSNGQILRYLEPEGDLERDSAQFKSPDGQQRSPLMPAETFLRILLSSIILPSGNELMLVRPGSDPRIYAVNTGGGVVRQKFQMPGKYSLLGVIPTPTGWIGQFSQPAGPRGMKLMLFSFDRQTGVAGQEYQYPGPFGLGLACSDGNNFLFLREETEDSFTLVRAQASGGAAGTSQPPHS